jgi:hypothetical protein
MTTTGRSVTLVQFSDSSVGLGSRTGAIPSVDLRNRTDCRFRHLVEGYETGRFSMGQLLFPVIITEILLEMADALVIHWPVRVTVSHASGTLTTIPGLTPGEDALVR